MSNRISELFHIRHPVIQAGMVWCSGWKLAAAVSNAGGLGLIGAGSMSPETLEEHIIQCRNATGSPFGVNVPLLYRHAPKHLDIIIKNGVKIIFTSAGNPSLHTPMLKEAGITVVHVVSSLKFALKARDCGADAVVAEGFEAGGHNGREETTTLCLLELLRGQLDIPVIAAGGIATGSAMLAAFALGAEGVQVGSAFAVAAESSAHDHFKKAVLDAREGSTVLTLKEITPVRLLKNVFYTKVAAAYANGAGVEELSTLLGHGRSKLGIFEGDLEEGELEIGQVAAILDSVRPAGEILAGIVSGFEDERQKLLKISI
jgi:enoyl-[acyl-carrier protein] reductase II